MVRFLTSEIFEKIEIFLSSFGFELGYNQIHVNSAEQSIF